MGLQLLDEVVFQQQRIFFRLDHGIVEVGDMFDQRARLAVQLFRRPEILGDTPFEVFCLAHIDDGAAGVEVAVHARIVRKICYFISDIH